MTMESKSEPYRLAVDKDFRRTEDFHQVYIIAEAGACGDGDLSKMTCLIDNAKQSGADAIKFQWTSNASLMVLQRGKAFKNGYVEVYGKYLQWPIEWHHNRKQNHTFRKYRTRGAAELVCDKDAEES